MLRILHLGLWESHHGKAVFSLYEYNLLINSSTPNWPFVQIWLKRKLRHGGGMRHQKSEADMQIAVPQPPCRNILASAEYLSQTSSLFALFSFSTGYSFSDPRKHSLVFAFAQHRKIGIIEDRSRLTAWTHPNLMSKCYNNPGTRSYVSIIHSLCKVIVTQCL